MNLGCAGWKAVPWVARRGLVSVRIDSLSPHILDSQKGVKGIKFIFFKWVTLCADWAKIFSQFSFIWRVDFSDLTNEYCSELNFYSVILMVKNELLVTSIRIYSTSWKFNNVSTFVANMTFYVQKAFYDVRITHCNFW